MQQQTHLPDESDLIGRIRALVDAGSTLAARTLLDAVSRACGPCGAIAELDARLLLMAGRLTEARDALDNAIAGWPEQPPLRMCRADVRARLGDLSGAAADAAEAVVLDPLAPRPKALLGAVLLELGHAEDAAACLAEAVRAAPDEPSFRIAYARALERTGAAIGAAGTLADGIRRTPAEPDLRTAAIMVAMRARDFAGAAEQAEQARIDGVANACVFGLLGHALSSLDRHADASAAYAQAYKLAPEDPYVRHLVSAAGLLPDAPRAPAAYVETVFDGYAERFDQHLISLGYRVPGLIRARILERLPAPDPAPHNGLGRVLDLGCGTGLMGVVLSDLPMAPLVGVDLSSGMLAEAASKNIYAQLRHADIETVLTNPAESWDVIVAADVFCYMGVLDGVLATARERLRAGGWLFFSVETDETPAEDGRGWRLGRLGRYLHEPAYIVAAIRRAGLRGWLHHETLREEGGAPVAGLVVAARAANVNA